MRLARSGLVVAVLTAASAAHAELPSEAVVPGEVAPAAMLPAESELPPYVAWQISAGSRDEPVDHGEQFPKPPATTPSENGERGKPSPATLPGENAVPAEGGAAGNAHAAGTDEDALPI